MQGTRPTVAAVLLVAFAATASGDEFDDACSEARRGQLPALVELATWCSENKLHATRNELALEILGFDGDNKQARKWLRHRLSGGVWKEPSRPPKVKDHVKRADAGYDAKRAELIGGVAAKLYRVLEDHEDLVTPARRERLLQEVIGFDPGNARYRAAHGEVRSDSGWELEESQRTRGRRKILAKAVRKGIAEAKPEAIGIPGDAKRTGLEWSCAWKTSKVTLLSTADAGEAKRIAKALHAAPYLMQRALGVQRTLPADASAYVLVERKQLEQVVRTHPKATDHNRRYAGKVTAHWLGHGFRFAAFNPDAERRVEGVARSPVSWLMIEEFGRGLPAWADEGFIIRLTWELVGTRLLNAVRPSSSRGAARDGRGAGRLLDDAGWYDAARKMLRETTGAKLAEMFAKPLNALTSNDRVLGHAVAAYYIEGRPEEAEGLLRRLGRSTPTAEAIADVSNLDPEALRLRMIRWLEERPED